MLRHDYEHFILVDLRRCYLLCIWMHQVRPKCQKHLIQWHGVLSPQHLNIRQTSIRPHTVKLNHQIFTLLPIPQLFYTISISKYMLPATQNKHNTCPTHLLLIKYAVSSHRHATNIYITTQNCHYSCVSKLQLRTFQLRFLPRTDWNYSASSGLVVFMKPAWLSGCRFRLRLVAVYRTTWHDIGSVPTYPQSSNSHIPSRTKIIASFEIITNPLHTLTRQYTLLLYTIFSPPYFLDQI
jgi:hypothetical protein